MPENVTCNTPYTLYSGRSKPAFAALGFIEVVHLMKIRIGNRRNDSLRDPIIRLDPECMATGMTTGPRPKSVSKLIMCFWTRSLGS